ncbi:MAG: PAS domain S-box protein [Dehalococcoidia bacterium]
MEILRSPRLRLMAAVMTVSGLAAVTWGTYLLGGTHTAFPHLFYVPIVLASAWFGPLGGLLAGLAAGLLAGPSMPLNVQEGTQQELSNWLIRAFAFTTVGGLVGAFVLALGKRMSVSEELRLRVEGELAERRRVEERFRVLVEGLQDHALYLLDADGRISGWNAAAARMTGYEEQEVIGQDGSLFFVPEDKQVGVPEQALRTAAEMNMYESMDWRMKKDGTRFWAHVVINPVYDADGKLASFSSLMRDISRRRELEETLAIRARQQQAVAQLGLAALSAPPLKTLFDQAVVAVADVLGTEHAHVLECLPDRSALVLHSGVGWDPGLIGQAVVGAGAESQAGFTLRTKGPVVAEDLRTETRFSVPQLALAQGAVSGMSVAIGGYGEPFGVLGTHAREKRSFDQEDVHFLQGVANVLAAAIERSRILEEQARFAAILETTPDLVGITDPAGKLHYANQAGRALVGLDDSADPREVNVKDFHPEWAAYLVMEEGVPSAIENGSWQGEVALKLAGGREIPASLVIQAHYSAEGTPVYLSFVARDLTSFRSAEQRIRFQAHLLDHVGQAIIATDAEGLVTYWNRAAELLYGWTAREAVGRPVFDLTPAEASQEQARDIMAHMDQGKSWSGDFAMRRKDGTKFLASVTNAPILDAMGKVTDIVGVSTDVSHQRRMESELQQARRMESIGRLAGGIAHDFNNLLTVINGYSELLVDKIALDQAARRYLDPIRDAGERAAALTRQLLVFSRKQELKPEVIDVNEVLPSLHRLLERVIGEDVDLVTELAPGVGRVLADPAQIEQVVLNLAVNAKEAMPGGGRLTIETSHVDLDESYAATHLDASAGPHTMIAVSDTGIGMDEEVLSNIFEPFFTTKEEGSGIGLPTVYGIVRQSGGHIRVYSEPDNGTTFKVYLPCTQEAARSQPEVDAMVGASGGTETVLVVEDREEVRFLMATVLRGHGYQVLEAGNGEEALSLMEETGDNVDLIVTDIVMPGMSGPELVTRLKEHFTTLRVVFVSGYPDAAVARQGILDAGSGYLQKPMTPTALLRMVRDLLDRPRQTADA